MRWLNALQSLGLLLALAALLGTVAYVIGGAPWVIIALAALGLLFAVSAWGSASMTMRLVGASEVSPWQAPALHHMLAELSRRAELPATPRLYFLADRRATAFAAGVPGDAAICFSAGILGLLNQRELLAVAAHEVSHIAHRDLQTMRFAEAVNRMTGDLATVGIVLVAVNLGLNLWTEVSIHWLVPILLVLAPQVSALLQLALSRQREYAADTAAAELTGDPVALASALTRLDRLQHGIWERVLTPQRIPTWLSTHPGTRQRVERLRELARHQGPDRGPAFPQLPEWQLSAFPGRRRRGLWPFL